MTTAAEPTASTRARLAQLVADDPRRAASDYGRELGVSASRVRELLAALGYVHISGWIRRP